MYPLTEQPFLVLRTALYLLTPKATFQDRWDRRPRSRQACCTRRTPQERGAAPPLRARPPPGLLRLAPPRCTWGGRLRSLALTCALCAQVSPPLHMTGASTGQDPPQQAVGEGPCVLACPGWQPESAAGGPSNLQRLTFLKEPSRQNHSASSSQGTQPGGRSRGPASFRHCPKRASVGERAAVHDDSGSHFCCCHTRK